MMPTVSREGCPGMVTVSPATTVRAPAGTGEDSGTCCPKGKPARPAGFKDTAKPGGASKAVEGASSGRAEVSNGAGGCRETEPWGAPHGTGANCTGVGRAGRGCGAGQKREPCLTAWEVAGSSPAAKSEAVR
mmetsp:Transcript_43794/g.126596  ORF Transcript_43794/g.126596 Transcript_43794/m.126596 type:complete len:132 (+) Transcript_43794:747-1142(+)